MITFCVGNNGIFTVLILGSSMDVKSSFNHSNFCVATLKPLSLVCEINVN